MAGLGPDTCDGISSLQPQAGITSGFSAHIQEGFSSQGEEPKPPRQKKLSFYPRFEAKNVPVSKMSPVPALRSSQTGACPTPCSQSPQSSPQRNNAEDVGHGQQGHGKQHPWKRGDSNTLSAGFHPHIQVVHVFVDSKVPESLCCSGGT